jgi:hypothetical protein
LIEAYCKLSTSGEFKYFSDFSAFNIPDYSLRSFIRTFGDDLLEHEKILFKELEKIIEVTNEEQPTPRSYFVATYTKNNDEKINDLQHEITHGLYYTESMYNRIMTDLLKEKQTLVTAFSKVLKDLSYCDDVLLDECQAYFATSSISELRSYGLKGFTAKDIEPFRKVYDLFKVGKRKIKSIGRYKYESFNRAREQQTT